LYPHDEAVAINDRQTPADYQLLTDTGNIPIRWSPFRPRCRIEVDSEDGDRALELSSEFQVARSTVRASGDLLQVYLLRKPVGVTLEIRNHNACDRYLFVDRKRRFPISAAGQDGWRADAGGWGGVIMVWVDSSPWREYRSGRSWWGWLPRQGRNPDRMRRCRYRIPSYQRSPRHCHHDDRRCNRASLKLGDLLNLAAQVALAHQLDHDAKARSRLDGTGEKPPDQAPAQLAYWPWPSLTATFLSGHCISALNLLLLAYLPGILRLT